MEMTAQERFQSEPINELLGLLDTQVIQQVVYVTSFVERSVRRWIGFACAIDGLGILNQFILEIIYNIRIEHYPAEKIKSNVLKVFNNFIVRFESK